MLAGINLLMGICTAAGVIYKTEYKKHIKIKVNTNKVEKNRVTL